MALQGAITTYMYVLVTSANKCCKFRYTYPQHFLCVGNSRITQFQYILNSAIKKYIYSTIYSMGTPQSYVQSNVTLYRKFGLVWTHLMTFYGERKNWNLVWLNLYGLCLQGSSSKSHIINITGIYIMCLALCLQLYNIYFIK